MEKNATKSERARKRWKILSRALIMKNLNAATLTDASVQRFSSYKLMNVCESAERNSSWYEYSSCLEPTTTVKVRFVQQRITANGLMSFNNTGNVRIWPSEEVLAYYCVKHKTLFSGKNICEIGGGMTCLSGLLLAMTSDANRVMLTDGNQTSVDKVIVNNNNFGDTEVLCRVLRWDVSSHSDGMEACFDYVICSDCLFFSESHADLVETIFRILKSNGEAVILAPSRTQTFSNFEKTAQTLFHVEKLTRYDDFIWNLHVKYKNDQPEVYDEDLCYPLMLKLFKNKHNLCNEQINKVTM